MHVSSALSSAMCCRRRTTGRVCSWTCNSLFTPFSALFLIEHLHTLLLEITALLYCWNYCINLLLKLLNYYVFLHGFSLNVSFILNGTSYKYKTLSLACTCSFVVCSSQLQQWLSLLLRPGWGAASSWPSKKFIPFWHFFILSRTYVVRYLALPSEQE